jgi:hypothetical protein
MSDQITVTRAQIEAAEKNLSQLRMNHENQVKGGEMSLPPSLCGPSEAPNALRRPQVHQDLEELGYAVDSLEKAIAGLRDRLLIVARPAPSVAGGLPDDSEQKVPLSSIISEYRKRIRKSQTIITELTDSLEV